MRLPVQSPGTCRCVGKTDKLAINRLRDLPVQPRPAIACPRRPRGMRRRPWRCMRFLPPLRTSRWRRCHRRRQGECIAACDGIGDHARAFAELVELEHAHRPVPQHGARFRDELRGRSAVSGPMSRMSSSGSTRDARTSACAVQRIPRQQRHPWAWKSRRARAHAHEPRQVSSISISHSDLPTSRRAAKGWRCPRPR